MKYLLFGMLLISSSCANFDDVRAGANGMHRVVVTSEEKEMGQRDAIDQANDFCDQYQKRAAFTSERTSYTGDVDEATYKRTKMVSRAAKTAGGTTYVMGGRKESKAGGIATVAGAGLDSALGKGYTVEMTFKCL